MSLFNALQLGGILYNSRYPPIPGVPRARAFGEHLWSSAMLTESFSGTAFAPPAETPVNRELYLLKNTLKLKKSWVNKENVVGLHKFSSRVVKKLVWMGQLNGQERLKALGFGIIVGEFHYPWIAHRWSIDAWTFANRVGRFHPRKTLYKPKISFSAQFPEPRPDSTTVLHRAVQTEQRESESEFFSVTGERTLNLKGGTVTDILTHGGDPDIYEIKFHYSESEDDFPLLDYLIRIDRLDKINQETNERFKDTMKEAVAVEELAADIVHLIEVRNSQMGLGRSSPAAQLGFTTGTTSVAEPQPGTSKMAAEAVSSGLPHLEDSESNFVVPPESFLYLDTPPESCNPSKEKFTTIVKQAKGQGEGLKSVAKTRPTCVRGDAGRQKSGIPVRILPPRVKGRQAATFGKPRLGEPSRNEAIPGPFRKSTFNATWKKAKEN